MKKFLSVLLSVVLLMMTAGVTVFSQSTIPATLTFTPGVYTGHAQGVWNTVRVQVTVSEHRIENIDILEQEETVRIMDEIERCLLPRIRQEQSLAVDIVSGATYSSYAVLMAVEDALKDSGVDMSALKVPVETAPANIPDEEVDVVIVGAGIAGLSTAASLGRDSDLRVVVLDKLSFTGGSATYSGGAIWARGTQWHERYDLDWEPDKLVEHMHSVSGDAQLNDALIYRIGDVADDYFDYIIQEGGPWDYGNVMKQTPLGTFPTHWEFTIAIGSQIHNMARLSDAGNEVAMFFDELAQRNDAEIRLDSKATSLIVEDGTVQGVNVETKDGSYTIHAKKVVLATGGFGKNEEYMKAYNAEQYGNVAYCNPGATGDGITMTLDLGTHMVNQGISGSAGVPDAAIGYKRMGGLGGVANLQINTEGQSYAPSQEVRYQPGQIGYSIYGDDSQYWTYLQDCLRKGFAIKADTPEELAEQIQGIDKEAFASTIYAYEAENGAFVAPYYAVTSKYTFYATIGGLACNENFELLGAGDQPIPNLYGVGELTFGNIFSDTYPGIGTAIALCTYGGKIVSDEILETM